MNKNIYTRSIESQRTYGHELQTKKEPKIDKNPK